MVVVNYYRILCTTDNKYVYTWSENEPTTCPENIGHSINSTETTIVKSIGGTEIRTGDDNRLIVAPSLMPDTYSPQFIGSGDDFANGTRGNGQSLHISMPDGSGPTMTTSARCIDRCLAIGAYLTCYGSNIADYLNINLVAPATPVTINGSNTGNCNLVNIGPGNIIIPAANNGTHDVDLTVAVNSNLQGPNPVLVTMAVPVPAEDISGNLTVYNGYFNWDEETGAITYDYQQQGQFNLFDFEITLSKWIQHWNVWAPPGMVHKHKFFLGNKGARILPHWKLDIITTRDVSHATLDPAVEYQLMFYIARKNTV